MAANGNPFEAAFLRRVAWVLFGVALAGSSAVFAQQPAPRKAAPRKAPVKSSATPDSAAGSPEQRKYKGIWEPVNYGKDIELTDVFFVTTDVGYVSGASGTILKTTDGGKTWTEQLGGEPESKDPPITGLRFVDQTHGWAVQRSGDGLKLLHTSDRENWEVAAQIPTFFDLAFSTPTNGVLLPGTRGFNRATRILHTADGGRTWKEAFPDGACQVTLEVEGLPKRQGCVFLALSMASPTVGYVIGEVEGVPNIIVVLRTDDGGASWRVSTAAGPGDVFVYGTSAWQTAYFTDASNGLFATSGNRFYATSDGGQTWRGVPGSAGPQIRFTDPEVGWAFENLRYTPTGYAGADYGGDNVLHYTTDGGRHWTTRAVRFPAGIGGFSVPRRDRAYVVGEHGMIYRYRVVPVEYTNAKAIEAPAMPGFDSPLNAQVGELQAEVQALQASFEQATPGGQPPPGDAAGATGASGFVDACCADKVQAVENTVAAVSAEVPKFSSRFRNLNLILAGLQLVGQLFGQANGLKSALTALRQARDPQSVSAALAELSTQVSGLVASTKSAFQNPGQPQQKQE